ncbi:hypothetical protein PB16LOC_00991 [Pectobacterium versatile]|uniref:phage tail fiber protein n=1 Tax=Pectobacterium versatile TaxID=2488639 RepID=UPI000F8F554E|nr:hypothetical protein [Pectobacterium versatile]RUR94694.1 hypothetical protein PB16LOC_00991 [Pectobacterium versatile]
MSEITPNDLPPINELDEFTAHIPELQTDTDVLAGTDGPANFQAQALANRTKHLKSILDAVSQQLTEINQAVAAAQQSADTAKQGADASMKKTANGSDIADKSAFRANIGLEVQTSSTDATPNRILKMAENGAGPFGLGSAASLLATTDIVVQLRSAASGYYRCAVNTVRAPSTAAWGFHVVRWDSNTVMVTAVSTAPAGGMQYIVIGPTTDSGWIPIYGSNNLSFPLSIANGGSNKNTGAFANGPNSRTAVTLSNFLSSVSTYGNNSAGSVSISDDGGNWHTYLSVKHRSGIDDGIDYGFMLTDRAMTTNSYSEIGLRKRTPAGWRGFVNLWHSENLSKQDSVMDTTVGRVLLSNAYGMGDGALLPATQNYAEIAPAGITRAFKSPANGVNWPTTDVAWVGQHWAYDKNAGASFAILSAQTLGSVRASIQIRRNSSNLAWLNVLLSNQYIADSGGFYKTASPVINIYSDGSFTTTAEAEGVNVERLSEGVYKITGCQGMHPDAAWNGIDGGVSNPKCRNGQELTWNNYEVDEDGSITVYTFHRVHPEAMPFAQNRLTLDKAPFDPEKGHTPDMEWPDQTPIDVPRGLFIQVRVNMPEHEPVKPAVNHSNAYCNTVSPAK